MQIADTIYALSSGRLPSGVAVVRLSGPSVRFVIETIAGSVPAPGRMSVKRLRASDGTALDTAVVAYFEAPRSFSGEDCGEFHVHGGRAIVDALLRTISEIEGTRPAEAGEFTRRAFLNGKLDLVQAEALADLIEAETEAQRRMAVYAAEGHVSRQYERWRSQILRIQATITADLDFGDEGDVPDSVAERIRQDTAEVHAELEIHLASQRQAEIIRDGFRVAIIGRPNAGKSSLLNTLAGRDVAIVTDEPGTTRDLVEVSLDLAGLKIIVTDTAGIRENAGAVERIGIARALQSAKTADLVLLLRSDDDSGELTEAEWGDSISVQSKCDLGCAPGRSGGADVKVSALTGEGIDGLLEIIRAKAQRATDSVDLGPQRLRHRDALRKCAAALDRAQTVEMALELRAEELRIAAAELGRVTGRIDVEEVLGEVFRAFCIGK